MTAAVSVGDRVKITGGQWAGRAGAVCRLCTPAFRDYCYVLLDPKPRERTEKRQMVKLTDLELEP